jgi:predicted DNA-binding protein (MmcQ/YjbR family)
MFAALGVLEEPNRLTLKCDPDYGALLIQQFDQISPGYHMNKHHWITIALDASVPTDLICELIVDSYELVVAARAIYQ